MEQQEQVELEELVEQVAKPELQEHSVQAEQQERVELEELVEQVV